MTPRCDGTMERCSFREKIESLWDFRNFIRGAAWVLGGFQVVIVGILLAMFQYMLSHVRFDPSPSAVAAPAAQHEATWTKR